MLGALGGKGGHLRLIKCACVIEFMLKVNFKYFRLIKSNPQ